VEAASKLLGGLEYNYALRGDNQLVTQTVPAAEQRRALRSLLQTISAEALTLPERILKILPPRAAGYPRNRETFRSRTGVTFDPVSAAEAAAAITLGQLLHPERAARLVQHRARDAAIPGFDDVAGAVLNATWKAARAPGLASEVQRTVDMVALYNFMNIAASETAAPQVRAIAWSILMELRRWADARLGATKDVSERAHLRFAAAQIERFERDPKTVPLPRPAEPPPGQPIGSDE
jgi:hypothetical protein